SGAVAGRLGREHFLRGDQAQAGGQGDEQSTAHLNAMNQMGNLPWPLSFSYGRAMQQAALKLWGKDMKGNYAAAQKTVYERAKENGMAALGKWNG
ncbi:MAG: class I fructose-bisphosphate aldolase, partial [Stenotrophomonas sp.]